jgi:hypothetical protein
VVFHVPAHLPQPWHRTPAAISISKLDSSNQVQLIYLRIELILASLRKWTRHSKEQFDTLLLPNNAKSVLKAYGARCGALGVCVRYVRQVDGQQPPFSCRQVREPKKASEMNKATIFYLNAACSGTIGSLSDAFCGWPELSSDRPCPLSTRRSVTLSLLH